MALRLRHAVGSGEGLRRNHRAGPWVPVIPLEMGSRLAGGDMPGHFGTLFAAPGDVGQLLSAVTEVLDHPSDEMLERAQRWLAPGNNDSTNPEELFTFIPRSLRMAHARNEGLLVLTAWG